MVRLGLFKHAAGWVNLDAVEAFRFTVWGDVVTRQEWSVAVDKSPSSIGLLLSFNRGVEVIYGQEAVELSKILDRAEESCELYPTDGAPQIDLDDQWMNKLPR